MRDGIDLLLDVLRERGLEARVRHDGTTYFRGPKSEVTPALKEMMAAWRDELLASAPRDPAPAEAPPAPRLREWQWLDGMTHAEEPTWASVGDPDHQPGLAVWWRWQGEEKWLVIPGREGMLHERNRPAPTFDAPAEALTQGVIG